MLSSCYFLMCSIFLRIHYCDSNSLPLEFWRIPNDSLVEENTSVTLICKSSVPTNMYLRIWKEKVKVLSEGKISVFPDKYEVTGDGKRLVNFTIKSIKVDEDFTWTCIHGNINKSLIIPVFAPASISTMELSDSRGPLQTVESSSSMDEYKVAPHNESIRIHLSTQCAHPHPSIEWRVNNELHSVPIPPSAVSSMLSDCYGSLKKTEKSYLDFNCNAWKQYGRIRISAVVHQSVVHSAHETVREFRLHCPMTLVFDKFDQAENIAIIVSTIMLGLFLLLLITCIYRENHKKKSQKQVEFEIYL